MFSFLNPGLLWALPLAAAPILLHLFFLRRARRVPFSDLTLLRAVFAQSRPASRLKQWLLLLLRCGLIACLIIAFARPLIHPDAALKGGSERGLDLVLLVDTSWSMHAVLRGKSRLSWAAAAGEKLLELLRPVDRAAVAGFSDRLEGELAWADGSAGARELLRRQRAGARTTDVGAAFKGAYAFLKRQRQPDGPPRQRIIVVLTDGAEHLFRRMPAGGLKDVAGYDPEVRLIGLRWDERTDNGGIAEVQPARSADSANDDRGELRVRAALYGQEREAWNIDMFLQGVRADQRSLRLAPDSSLTAAFRLPASRGGEQWGRFEMRSDALSIDDSYYFSLRVQPKPKVLLLYGSPNYLEAGQGGYFIRKLISEGEELPYRLDLADLGRLSRLRLDDYSAVLLTDFKELGEGVPETLTRYVARGGGLWVVAGTRAEPAAYARLARLLPGSIGGERVRGGSAAALRPDDAVIAPELKPEGFAWSDFELNRVTIERSYELVPRPDAQVWFRSAAGDPLLLAGSFGRGRVLLWGSALDIRWTNLALKPVFAAWLDVGLRYLTRYSDRLQWRTLHVDEPIVRVWGGGENVPPKVQLRGPDGRRTTLLVHERQVSYPDTRTPGLYYLQAAVEGAPVEAYAVNVDRSGPEGDLTPARDAPWLGLRPEAAQEDFLRSVYGREVRTGALALALLILFLELLLSRPRKFTAALLLLLGLCAWGSPAAAQEGDRFVWSQLGYTGAWDPYPNVHSEVLNFVTQVTSVIVAPERRVLRLKDGTLFSSPFVVLSGKQAPPELDAEEIGFLRDYLTSGGFLWIEDAAGTAASPFDRWVRRTLAKVLPDSDLKPLPSSHVLFKTFFLLRRIGGRVMISGSVEGADWAGKTVVVYSHNDLLGAWAKDPLGKFLYECVPGGEAQRMEARKLSLNIIMYALTGSYKADAVHQPFILQKMRQPQ
ncbi:MAG: DUF4159 domain-containing protein [Elusimicrobiota bacterium]